MIPQWQRPAQPAAPTPELDKAVMLVFKDRAQNDRFMELLHLSTDDKYVSGEMVADLVREALIP